MATRATVTVTAVMALVTTAGCSAVSEPAEAGSTATTTSAPSSSSTQSPTTSSTLPAADPTATQPPAAAEAVLSAGRYHHALRTLTEEDTGYFEMNVVSRDDADNFDLLYLPRMAGGWQITNNGSMVTTFLVDADRSHLEASYLAGADGQTYFRAGGEDSAFGTDCWMRASSDSGTLAGRSVGLPSALYLLDTYRPAGQQFAGTSSLASVLGALGFQKVVNSDPTAARGARVPVELELVGGEFSHATVYPADLVAALGQTDEAAPARQIIQLLDEVTPAAWTIRYTQFGQPIDLSAPPADKLIDLDDETATCDS